MKTSKEKIFRDKFNKKVQGLYYESKAERN
jgi:hypothetical protein